MFFEGGLLSACSGQCGQMCVLYVVYLDLMNTCSALLQTQPAYGNRAENTLGIKIPAVLDLALIDSYNKQTYEIVFKLTCLKYGLSVLRCISHIHSVRTEFNFCSATRF